MDGGYAENAGAIFGAAMDGGYAGLSRPSMAFEALGLLPGEMQEQFSAPPSGVNVQEQFSVPQGVSS